MKKLLTTHVGSLPFSKIQSALEYTFRFDLPVLFTLPNMSENQFIGRDICHLLDIGDYTEDHKINLRADFRESSKSIKPFNFEPFIKQLRSSRHEHFKYQIIGPFSFYKMLLNSELEMGEVFSFLLEKYQELITLLNDEFSCLLMLDEPMLNQANMDEIKSLNQFVSELSTDDKYELGIHVCSKLQIDTANMIKARYLNLDLNLYLSKEILMLKGINFFGLKSGLVNSQLSCGDIKQKLNQISYICPSCGLFFESEEELETVFNNLTHTKQLFLA